MPSWQKSIPIDLSVLTEATRRQLYDAVVAIHFTPNPGEVLAAKRAEEWYQKYSADECGLQIVYLFGRWFVVWRQWEGIEDDTPEAQEWEVLTVNARPGARF